MNYDEFKEQLFSYLQEHISEYLPPQYANGFVSLCSNVKNNGEMKDGIQLNVPRYQTAPIIYVNDMYNRFSAIADISGSRELTESDMRELTEEIANYLVNHMKNPFISEQYGNNAFSEICKPERLYMALVNTDANQQVLSECPHREVLDLSITYRLNLPAVSGSQMGSVYVTNAIAEYMGMTEEQIFQYAYVNTRKFFPPSIMTMGDMFSEIGEEPIDEMDNMLIVSNNLRMHGACMMLYPDVLDELAERVGDELYILPSSVHEFLAVPGKGELGEKMEEMVQEVNSVHVDVAERLSNHAYFYDAKAKKIDFATANPVPSVNPALTQNIAVHEPMTYGVDMDSFPDTSNMAVKQGNGTPSESASVTSVRQRGPKF